jgi:hypothetical protein
VRAESKKKTDFTAETLRTQSTESWQGAPARRFVPMARSDRLLTLCVLRISVVKNDSFAGLLVLRGSALARHL